MEIIDLEAIESLGHLLAYYKSDLEYIAQFNLFKNNQITIDDYLVRGKGFQEFINEFRVARNIKKDRVKDLLEFIKNSILHEDDWTVDKFAKEMKNRKLTHENKVMKVLASKIFFLNQPDKIVPMDSLNKKAFGLQENKYESFENKINGFINENCELLSAYLDSVEDYLTKIENNVNIGMDFEKYRINRFTDKYLWVKGRKLNIQKKSKQ